MLGEPSTSGVLALEELRRSSSTLSCRGRSRTSRARRAAGRGEWPSSSSQLAARRDGSTARPDGRRAGRRRVRGLRRAARCGRPRRSPAADELVAAIELDANSLRGPPALGVEDVCRERDAHGANFSAWRRCSRAISSSSARTRRPSRTTSSPPTSSRSTRCGAGEHERRRRGRSTRRARARPSARRRCPRSCPASSEPMSSRSRTAAPPRVPSESASRAVIASGPPRPRATSSACFTSQKQVAALVRGRAVDAEPDANARVEQLAHRRDPRAEPQVRGRTVRDARACLAEARDVPLVEVDAVRAPDVAVEPAELLEVLDRPAPVELLAVGLLLDRLGEVRVQRQPEPPRELGRLLHQAARDRERRARRDGELPVAVARRASRSVSASTSSSVLDERVGRQAAVRLAEVHRAARGDEPHAELARRRSSPPRSGRRPPRGKT